MDPFGYQGLRAKPMDNYNSVLGSNKKGNGEQPDERMIMLREFTRN